jgi:hypothetical protein
MATQTMLDGRKYEIGNIYYTGTVLQLARHGDPRIIHTDISPDELDEFAEEFPIRIFTSSRRQKRKNRNL